MKLKIKQGKYILDKEDLRSLFLYIYDKGLQNGILIEGGIGSDRSEDEVNMFLGMQGDLTVKRQRKTNLPSVDYSKPLQQRKKEFANKIAEFKSEYTNEQLREFYDYWSEHKEGGNQMLFERREVFNIKSRLQRFKFNSRKKQPLNQPKETRLDRYKKVYEQLNSDHEI